MNKVVSINLNGNAYQLEEHGFDALTAYLAQAKARLAGNPDQSEIIADLEQAIADKFRRFLSGHKSVLTDEEVATVIREMGPVSGSGEAQGDEDAPRPHAAKRLYRVREGDMIAGVANGLAAYFNIDVVPVRLLFVILLFATSGGFIFAYLLAWIFIPEAVTPEQRAEASGTAFTAEELISRAKAEYAKFDGKRHEWKKQWRDWKREMKQQHRAHEAWKRQERSARRQQGPGFFGELALVVVCSFFIWLGYHHVPAIHDFLDAAWQLWQRVADAIAQAIVANT
ncbi:MAG TPA: PspC domain-containing protein [Candidatus Paceibacterota bacterium]